MTTFGSVVPRSFYARDSTVVAPALLNKVLVLGDLAGRIVDVEAYAGEHDPASHAYRGQTARNAAMFGEPGHAYVYFTYGMHWCVNAVCREPGEASAVLLRGLEPLAGLDAMQARRKAARRPQDLTNGPAKLCEAFGIDRALDGADLVRGEQGLRILDDGVVPPTRPGRSVRIGISTATELRWRWYVPGNAFTSRPDR